MLGWGRGGVWVKVGLGWGSAIGNVGFGVDLWLHNTIVKVNVGLG